MIDRGWDSSLRSDAGPSGLNWDVVVCVMMLLAIGTVMVFSATTSFGESAKFHATNLTYLWRHLQSMAVALAAGAVVYRIPMSFWFRWWWLIGGSVIGLLLLVFVPGLGRTVNGATRWVSLGGLNLQVSEMVKVAALIYTAAFVVRRQDFMHSFTKGFLPMALVMMLISFLLMRQPDLGATVVIAAEIMGTLFLGGLSMHIFVSVAAVVVAFVVFMIMSTPWRVGRVLAYCVDTGCPARVTGLELDPKLAREAASWASAYPNLEVRCGSVLDEQLAPYTHFYLFNPFDTAVLTRFLDRLERQARLRPSRIEDLKLRKEKKDADEDLRDAKDGAMIDRHAVVVGCLDGEVEHHVEQQHGNKDKCDLAVAHGD